MASPKQAITRLDLSMSFSEWNNSLNRRNYIGHLVFPALPVEQAATKFHKLPAEALITPVEDTKRAPKSGYKRDDFEWTEDSYTTQEHGVEETTDDHQIALYGEVPAEAINRDRAVNRVAQAYEAACAAAAFNGSNSKDVVTDTGSGYSGVAWSDQQNADPIHDLDQARETFLTQCGYYPNALVMEQLVATAILRSARIEDLVKYTGQLDSHTVMKLLPQLAEIFQIERIIVAKAPIKNTGLLGGDPVFTRIWDPTKVLLTRVYDGPDLESPEPFYGRTVMWSAEAGPLPGADGDGMGVIVEEYREETRRGGVIRARTNYEIKKIHEPAGLVLTGVRA